MMEEPTLAEGIPIRPAMAHGFSSLPGKGAAFSPAGVLARLFAGAVIADRDAHIASLLHEMARRGAELDIYRERTGELEARLAEEHVAANRDLRKTCDWLARQSSKPPLFDTSSPDRTPQLAAGPILMRPQRSKAEQELAQFYSQNHVGGEKPFPAQELPSQTDPADDAPNTGDRPAEPS